MGNPAGVRRRKSEKRRKKLELRLLARAGLLVKKPPAVRKPKPPKVKKEKPPADEKAEKPGKDKSDKPAKDKSAGGKEGGEKAAKKAPPDAGAKKKS